VVRVKQERRGHRRLLFVFSTAILVLAAVELVGSVAYLFLLPETERQAIEATLGLRRGEWNSTLRYRSHPYLDYIANPDYTFEDGTRPHDAIGIRDPGFPPRRRREGVFRILALGGSTTYGLFVERADQVWPTLVGTGLQETLGREVEVINAAVPSYTTNEIVVMAAFWLPEFRPDLVLLHTGINDAFTVAFEDEGGPDGRHFRHAWSHRELPPAWSRVMRASRLVRLLGVGMLRSGGYMAGDMAGAIQNPLPPEAQLRSNIESATGKYYRRNLETIVALAKLQRAVPVFVEMPLNPKYEGGIDLYRDAISAAVARNNRIMREVGEDLGVQVVATNEAMRDPENFIDAAHVTQVGMMRKAQLVYDALLPVVKEMSEQPSAVAGLRPLVDSLEPE